MENNSLLNVAKSFAAEIAVWSENEQNDFMFKDELVRGALNMGALLHAAQFDVNKEAFEFKLARALEECALVEYWLEIVCAMEKLDVEKLTSLKSKAVAIRRTLLKICVLLKKKEKIQ